MLKAEPVPAAEVTAASATMRLSFPADYSEFLERYGAALVGPFPIFGLRAVEAMGNEWSVVEVNRRYRADNWPGVQNWLVVSADHSGNPMGIDRDGRVWISDHDLGGISPVGDDFEDFLRKKCLDIR
jgi:hypothetical protein